MNRWKPNLPVIFILGWIVALGSEVQLLQREFAQAARAQRRLRDMSAEREWLAGQSPAATPQNEQALAAEVGRATDALNALRAKLRGEKAGWYEAHPPARPLDAFFDIASFVENMRAAAVQANIGLAADERFGFATYAGEGPGLDLLPEVYRQRLISQRLLEALFDAKPTMLLGLQREEPAAKPASPKVVPADYFPLPPALSLRQPGLLDTRAFRLEFSGQTEVLRKFLGNLAGLSQAFVVRSVEVELRSATGVASRTDTPVVRQEQSKFTVVVEFAFPGALPAQPIP